MSMLLGFAGFIAITDAFDGRWSPRKEWEVVIGLVLVVLAALIYCFAERDS